MATINQLSLLDNLSTADQLVVYSTANGDARRTPVNSILTLVSEQFMAPGIITQFATPTSTGTVAVPAPTVQTVWLLLQPAGTLSSLSIVLPQNTITPDGTELLITTTQQITAVTFVLNGATSMYGSMASLSAEDFARFRFYRNTNSWYRVA